MIVFMAHKHKSSEDKEGELTLILKVPQSHAKLAQDIPVLAALKVSIEVTD